jgi:hypothetical protein
MSEGEGGFFAKASCEPERTLSHLRIVRKAAEDYRSPWRWRDFLRPSGG